MSGVREGSATPNAKGYSMHGEGSETEGRRALSGDGHLVRAGLREGRGFVVARGASAWSRGGVLGGGAGARSRCAYALRAADTCEVRPARRVERTVSTYTGMIPGTPSPPSSVGVRARSVVLHSVPRAVMPSECFTHRAARQRASVKTSQMGTPPWTGKTRRRQSVFPMTSLSCEKDGISSISS